MRMESVAKPCGKKIQALKGGGVSNKRVGASGDGGIKQLRRCLKPGYTRESPPPPPLMFALAGVLGDSSVAKPLIGAASPGNPNYRPGRDGCARGGELNRVASLHLTGLPLQYRRPPPRGARDVADKHLLLAGLQGSPHNQQLAPTNLVEPPRGFHLLVS